MTNETETPSHTPLEIVEVAPTSEEAMKLIAGLSSELAGMFDHADDGSGNYRPDEALPNSVFIIGRCDGVPVACGAIRPLEPGVAELKRMFVRQDFRGRGFSRQILSSLESKAAAFGYASVRLETGDRQLAAIGLYQRLGYRRCEPFGIYVNSTQSVCLEKRLASPDNTAEERTHRKPISEVLKWEKCTTQSTTR